METEGWGKCFGTPKWHYFVDGRSLCRRFMLFGPTDLEQGNDDSPDNCKDCTKRLVKRNKNV